MNSQAAADSSLDQPEAADNPPSDGHEVPTEDASEETTRYFQVLPFDNPLDHPFSALDPNGNPFKVMDTFVEWDVMHKILHKIEGVLAPLKVAFMRTERESIESLFVNRFESWIRELGGVPSPTWTQQTHDSYLRWRANHWAIKYARYKVVSGSHLIEREAWWHREMYHRQWLPVIKLLFMFNGQHYCRWCLKEKYEKPRSAGLCAIHRPTL